MPLESTPPASVNEDPLGTQDDAEGRARVAAWNQRALQMAYARTDQSAPERWAQSRQWLLDPLAWGTSEAPGPALLTMRQMMRHSSMPAVTTFLLSVLRDEAFPWTVASRDWWPSVWERSTFMQELFTVYRPHPNDRLAHLVRAKKEHQQEETTALLYLLLDRIPEVFRWHMQHPQFLSGPPSEGQAAIDFGYRNAFNLVDLDTERFGHGQPYQPGLLSHLLPLKPWEGLPPETVHATFWAPSLLKCDPEAAEAIAGTAGPLPTDTFGVGYDQGIPLFHHLAQQQCFALIERWQSRGLDPVARDALGQTLAHRVIQGRLAQQPGTPLEAQWVVLEAGMRLLHRLGVPLEAPCAPAVRPRLSQAPTTNGRPLRTAHWPEDAAYPDETPLQFLTRRGRDDLSPRLAERFQALLTELALDSALSNTPEPRPQRTRARL